MDIDGEKFEQAVLAFCTLTRGRKVRGDGRGRAFPWSVMDALHDQGYISDPATKNKWVWLSGDGTKLSEESFEKLFAVKQ